MIDYYRERLSRRRWWVEVVTTMLFVWVGMLIGHWVLS